MKKSYRKLINIIRPFGIGKKFKQVEIPYIDYPKTEVDDSVVDNYFGREVADPYRWLEDIHSSEVNDFIDVQNEFTNRYLKSDESGGDNDLSKVREQIKARLTDLWMYCDYECPFKRGDRYFYLKNGALYAFQSNSFENKEHSEGDVELVFDPGVDIPPSPYSSEGQGQASLSVSTKEKTNENYGNSLISISNDGNTLAYGVSQNGSVWCVIHFMSIGSGEVQFEDKLGNVRHDTYLSWMKDDSGLFYGLYRQFDVNFLQEGIFFHRLGTPQTEDKLAVQLNPKWELKPRVSDCGKYLIVYIIADCGGHTKVNIIKMKNLLASLDSDYQVPQLIQLVKDFNADYDYITNVDSIFYFLTNKKAPRGKVVQVDVLDKKSINQKVWKCIIPQHKKSVLSWVTCVNQDYLMVGYIQNAHSVLQLRFLSDGSLIYQFPLGLGSISGYTGRVEDTQFFFKFTSFLNPCTIYHVNLEKEEMIMNSEKYLLSNEESSSSCCSSCLSSSEPKNKFEVQLNVFRHSLPKGFNQKDFEISQVFYLSKDRMADISMFLVHKRNLKRNGMNPCLLQGYGGFNASLQPNFNPTSLFFVQHFDGIYAVANIRGGGEYGRNWYESGIRENKQKSFDDFQSAAKYLFRSRYTCPQKLVIQGNSNGGLVVAACVNQAPKLFGAAIVGFGVLDLLRFHIFTSGLCWISDYGNPDNKNDCKNLLQISPLHNVKPPESQNVQYPAMLFITGDNDEVVVPMHSYKMIAQLQSKIGGMQKQKNPLLLRVERNAGHGEGMPFDNAMDEITDILIFMNKSLNLNFRE